MFLRNLIIYTVAGTVLWVIAQPLVAGIGVALALILLVSIPSRISNCLR